MVWWTFLSNCAILPMLTRFIPNVDLAFGGTSILIVVGVALEMVQQLESLLVNETLQRDFWINNYKKTF